MNACLDTRCIKIGVQPEKEIFELSPVTRPTSLAGTPLYATIQSVKEFAYSQKFNFAISNISTIIVHFNITVRQSTFEFMYQFYPDIPTVSFR